MTTTLKYGRYADLYRAIEAVNTSIHPYLNRKFVGIIAEIDVTLSSSQTYYVVLYNEVEDHE